MLSQTLSNHIYDLCPKYCLLPWIYFERMAPILFVDNPHFFDSDVFHKNIHRFNSYDWIKISSKHASARFIQEHYRSIITHMDKSTLPAFIRNIALFPNVLEFVDVQFIDMNHFKHNLCLNRNPEVMRFIGDHMRITSDMLENLCHNPMATQIIRRYKHKLYINQLFILCQNDAATELLDHSAINKLNNLGLYLLCRNRHAIDLIKRYTHTFDEHCWRNLCRNENPLALEIIEQNIDKLDLKCWRALSMTKTKENANFLSNHIENMDEICWNGLCLNPNAIFIIENNMETIINHTIHSVTNCFASLCLNPNATHIIEQHIHQLDDTCWKNLCKNPNATHIIEAHIEVIHRLYLWESLCCNKNAIHIIQDNLDAFDDTSKCWYNLCENPSVFTKVDNDLFMFISDLLLSE